MLEVQLYLTSPLSQFRLLEVVHPRLSLRHSEQREFRARRMTQASPRLILRI